ncbi:hypothetical protein TK11N_06680 [Tetragenococcus koreensis]|uniref:Glutamine amidotransferase type-2 domain-containing protein n=1 Tax=Tetragenococcus koreensis TaxID=290335 RepID=A0AAN4RK05_9ENTE|nr:hypothetical protein TK11N_06680 [Tetragenococcus koreensis]GEQ51193.1 hypothetical protein TK12N_05370 [Tetragenococcus koreensis]GEQ53842.1 hypothetical protein TK2N_06860 [Tetragenococcus koreensis]GEQ56194.1 hypothetical protein TK4N_05370 [Tetragenococcus koreensis]GEQ58829.1 hypothetical protein TK6N_06680 [Tetragenococcus koreensis]
MCGIVGFVNNTYSFEEKNEQIEQMMERIAHRGPDNSGKFIDGGGGTRLPSFEHY